MKQKKKNEVEIFPGMSFEKLINICISSFFVGLGITTASQIKDKRKKGKKKNG